VIGRIVFCSSFDHRVGVLKLLLNGLQTLQSLGGLTCLG